MDTDTEHYPTGNRLDGKRALITGGARGMGAAFARAMVRQGAQVVIADVLDDDGEVVAKEIGDACHYLHLDITDRAQWDAVVAEAVARLGGLNVLVNNAGILSYGPIGTFTYDQWDRIIAVNLTGAFNGITAALDPLKASAPSSIINVSSTAGIHGYAALPGYCASKWGLRGLSKAAALDLAQYDIRVNSVHPGGVKTPMTEGYWDAPQDQVAMHRMGEEYELAHLVVFLASDESSYSTGAEFIADGGESVGLPPSTTTYKGSTTT